jgi:LmbE family N-acetylglucosaminyl deacetylase
MSAMIRPVLPARGRALRALVLAVACSTASFASNGAAAQAPSRTLVAVLAHADDETAVAPLLARYAREGARVFMVIVTDGAQGTANTAVPAGEALASVRAQEAKCAADALGAAAPILLGFPDGRLGDYIGDRSLMYRATQRIAEELEKLRPDAVVTWGPDGGIGHPDHRLVSNVVTQLARAGAPGVPERVFYMYLPVEGIRVMNPQRGEPPLLIPQAKHFTVRVPFEPADLEAAQRSMACHRTQFTEETLERVFPLQARVWNGVIPLVPASPADSGTALLPNRVRAATGR